MKANTATANHKPEHVKQSWGPFLRVVRDHTPWIMMILAVVSSGYSIFFDVLLPELQGRIMGGEIFDMGLIWEFIGVNLLSVALYYVSAALQSLAEYKMTYNMQNALWKRLIGLPMKEYNRVSPSTLISRVTNDTYFLPSQVYSTLSLVVRLASVANQFRAIYMIHPKIALNLLFTVPYMIVVMVVPGRIQFTLNRKKQHAYAQFTGFVTERLMNFKLIKAASSEAREDKVDNAVLNANYRARVSIDVVDSIISPFIMSLEGVMTAVALVTAAGLQTAGEIDASAIPTVYLQSMMLFFSLFIPMTSYMDIKRAQGNTSEVSMLLDEKPESMDQEKTFTMDEADIIFDDVSFRYQDKDVLSHVSFTIPHGKTTAIVGPSGAGKTTVLNLLERLYQPNGGTIRFGDIPVEQINLGDWRRAMGYIQQDSPLISGTVRDNIGYGLDSTPSQEGVEEAAALANAAGFIETLPDGYDTDLGQMGGKLSGGERQRVALARMIITQPNYLLLDEATANLDAENANAIHKALRQVSVGRTSVIVAHDINTVLNADHIIVMDNGQVQAAGNRDEVYQNSPIFRRYCDLLASNPKMTI